MSHLIAIASILITVMSAVIGLVAKHQHQLGNLAERLSIVETRMGLFWHSVEQHVAQMFKLPTHYRMDELIDKFSERRLSYEESRELYRLLQERLTYPDVTPERRLWGTLVLQGIRSYQIELDRRARQRASWWARLRRWWRGRTPS